MKQCNNLISKERLVDTLYDCGFQVLSEHTMKSTIVFETIMKCINCIAKMPPVYSVEKVVEELKELVTEVEPYKEYKTLEEQGLLLRLPCKIGDTIYEVSYENREFVIKEHIVKEFIYRTYRFPRIEIYCENENGFLVCNNIGKLDECLFLTKAEATADNSIRDIF